jgi:hypothetical protein
VRASAHRQNALSNLTSAIANNTRTRYPSAHIFNPSRIMSVGKGCSLNAARAKAQGDDS